MSTLTESLRRLFLNGKVTTEKLEQMQMDGKITAEEFSYITKNSTTSELEIGKQENKM
ncbi:MAG: XkdX family protein [Anaerotignum sp.]|nr:XkdX family protein [Anaerotignum sp.]MDY3925755.1 XkdX family protein [Anaerotignum sp.]